MDSYGAQYDGTAQGMAPTQVLAHLGPFWDPSGDGSCGLQGRIPFTEVAAVTAASTGFTLTDSEACKQLFSGAGAKRKLV
jgi:hypothetical protein